MQHSTSPSSACRRGDRLVTRVEKARDSEEKEELELFLDIVEEGVGIGEGVEDITLSLCVPCECLSFRLRNLLIVLMLGQVLQDKTPAAVHLTNW